MQVPLEIAYHQITKSEAIDQLIREKADHMETFCDRITSCAIAVERPNLNQRTGNPYRVRIDVHVPPGHEIVGVAGQEHNDLHDELRTVVIDAFDKVERQLKELTERQHQKTKTHVEPVAVITQLNLEERYGYITDQQGRDIYFNGANLIGHDFEALSLGMPVVYSELTGTDGLEAQNVTVAV